VLENDPFALEGLKHTQEWVKENLDLQLNLKIRRGDFQRVSQEKLQDSSFDTLLVNPPRSGLMKSAELISRQKNLIYVSCSAESAHRDHLILKNHYDLKELIILDQFPWTTHFELILLYQTRNLKE
jgi:tRNA/tmRNA/rRNA uracil-C5-methylase (TrmA/RlmC/RlmD family)